MRLIPVLVAAATISTAWAQNPGGPSRTVPPEVDQALRERINIFYQAHVDGKFRLADTVVHEDSKDIFFAAEKQKLRGFEIKDIRYTDNFTRAVVVVDGDTDMFFPGVGPRRVSIPLRTMWKLDDGQWYWYVEPRTIYETPFGTMKSAPEGKGDAPAAIPVPNPADIAKMLKLVQIDKSEVHLTAGEEATAELVVSNGMPGGISLSLQYVPRPDLEIKLDRAKLAVNEKARVSIRYRPSGAEPPDEYSLRILVAPTGRVFPVRITFDHP